MAYEFTAGESVAESFAQAWNEQLDRAVRALSEEWTADPVGAIHAARKAIKKERALLRLGRGALGGEERRRLNRELRSIGQGLSGLRDSEVMVQTLEKLTVRFAGQLPEATFSEVRELLDRDRRAQHDGAAGGEAISAAAAHLEDLRGRVDELTLDSDGWPAIDGGLMRTYRDGRRAMREASRTRTLEALHDWRKRVKDLWYELRLLAPVCGPAFQGAAAEAGELADILGDDHDLGMLRQTLLGRATEPGVDLEALIGLIDYRREQLQTQAVLIGERLYAERPGAFRRRIRRCWSAGRAEHRAFEARHPSAVAQPIISGRPNTRSNASSSP